MTSITHVVTLPARDHLTSKRVRKREVKLRSAEYCDSAKGLRIFRRRKVVGDTSSKP